LGLRLPQTPGLSVDRSLFELALKIKSESTEIPEIASRNVTLAAPGSRRGRGRLDKGLGSRIIAAIAASGMTLVAFRRDCGVRDDTASGMTLR
jgi:hypothetical protein